MQTYDFTASKKAWGWALQHLEVDREKWQISGVGHANKPIQVGDNLLISMSSGKTARLEVLEIKWYADPHDMFQFNSQHIGYVEDEV